MWRLVSAVPLPTMWWLVSAVPLRASSPILTTTKESLHDLHFALPTLPLTKAQKVLGSCSSNKQILSVKRICQHMSGTRFLGESFSYNLNVDYYTEIVISGYWVGPDADDGWGFVQAVINQMT
ncbi:hypothetical protein Lal_00000213 [Lupinus albus]|uniref:Uncharacterized protein n=1 Tax=Lupinus albus TaxID=3870 RepID=A0A6A4N5Z7_LUPAL|nr:hypothetical protein Lalb_Chr21g0310671 [Lupinus albus]KAF1860800.1 hypothetical protein Lal_00000213 [Lupinus albus]